MNTKKSNENNKHRFSSIKNTVFYLMVITSLLLAGSGSIYAEKKLYMTVPTDHDQLFDLMPVGEGEYTWFGLSIYEASLWTTTGTFEDLNNSYPVALIIHYQKNIESNALAEQTVSEWEHLNIFDNETRSYWGDKLAKIWPDVKPSDFITTLVTADRKTLIYHNDSLLTQLDDPSFGTALLSIWLDEDTSDPDLRAKLIGQRAN